MSKIETQTTHIFPRPHSPTKADLRPNPHPYAIQTSSSAVLSRFNSSPRHKKETSHHYVPNHSPSPSQDRGYRRSSRGHSYSKSLSSDGPRPLPTPPALDSASSEEFPDIPKLPTPRRSKRADTLPTPPPSAPPTLGAKASAMPVTLEDLPSNPKLWSPSQLASYLATALRVKSGETLQLPAPIAKDIADFVRSSKITGKVFLRFNEEDLESYGINKLWRTALLSASRSLRQNVLKGRIWGFEDSPPQSPAHHSDEGREEDDNDGTPSNKRRYRPANPFTNGTVVYSSASSSSSVEDLNPTSGNSLGGSPWGGRYKNGRVKGMVASFERSASFDEEDQARPEYSFFSKQRQRSGSFSDGSENGVFESAIEDEPDADIYKMAKVSNHSTGSRPLPTPPHAPAIAPSQTIIPSTSEEEPTIEELLAENPNLHALHPNALPRRNLPTFRNVDSPNVSRTGVHAWEVEQDGDTALVTVKHLPSYATTGNGIENPGKKVTDIFTVVAAEPTAGSTTTIQLGTHLVKTDIGVSTSDFVDPLLHAQKEDDLRSEMETTRSLIRQLEFRLEEVESKITEMEQNEETRRQQDARDLEEHNTHDRSSENHTQSKTLISSLFDPKTMWGNALCRVFGMPSSGASSAESRDRRPPMYDIIDRIMEPKTLSALPPYIILVSLGMCAVVLKVVMRRRR